jgi:hypothetical protein
VETAASYGKNYLSSTSTTAFTLITSTSITPSYSTVLDITATGGYGVPPGEYDTASCLVRINGGDIVPLEQSISLDNEHAAVANGALAITALQSEPADTTYQVGLYCERSQGTDLNTDVYAELSVVALPQQ